MPVLISSEMISHLRVGGFNCAVEQCIPEILYPEVQFVNRFMSSGEEILGEI